MKTSDKVVIGATITALAALLVKRAKVVVLKPGLASLFGTVTDADTGQPISDVHIWFGVWDLGVSDATTNSAGEYSFNNVEPGGYQVNIEKTGYESVGVMITLVSGSNEQNISMIPSVVPIASLSGFVTDANTDRPVSGVKVTIAGLSTYTDANGEYGFTTLTPGNYAVVFEKAGYNKLTL